MEEIINLDKFSLSKPEGSNIYDIGVFNENSTKIENAVKLINDKIKTNSDSSYSYSSLDNKSMDNLLPTGAYGVLSTTSGTLPEGIDNIGVGILLSEIKEDKNLQVLFLNDGIFYREYPTSSSWITVKPIDIVDNLTSTDKTAALSANMGLLLNNSKLHISNSSSINVDDCDKGVYCCYNLSADNIFGELPDELKIAVSQGGISNFILVTYGSKNGIRFQQLSDYSSNKTFYRWGKLYSSGGFIYNNWYTNDNISSYRLVTSDSSTGITNYTGEEPTANIYLNLVENNRVIYSHKIVSRGSVITTTNNKGEIIIKGVEVSKVSGNANFPLYFSPDSDPSLSYLVRSYISYCDITVNPSKNSIDNALIDGGSIDDEVIS